MAGDRVRDPDAHADSSCRRERCRRRAEHGPVLTALGQRHLVEAELVGPLRDCQRVAERALVRERQAQPDEPIGPDDRAAIQASAWRARMPALADDVLGAVRDVVHRQHEQVEAAARARRSVAAHSPRDLRRPRTRRRALRGAATRRRRGGRPASPCGSPRPGRRQPGSLPDLRRRIERHVREVPEHLRRRSSGRTRGTRTTRAWPLVPAAAPTADRRAWPAAPPTGSTQSASVGGERLHPRTPAGEAIGTAPGAQASRASPDLFSARAAHGSSRRRPGARCTADLA